VRIHRVHCQQDLEPGQEAVIEGDRGHYLARVLRVRPGQPIVLFNGDGFDYAAEVLQAARNRLTALVDSRLPAVREPQMRLTVTQAISRGERMDLTLQKCTELGACEFRPLVTERVEVRLGPERAKRRLAHWRGVVVSACEQSGRAVVPAVHSPIGFRDWLASDEAHGQRVALDPAGETSLARLDGLGELELVCGPEGGFSEDERAAMGDAGVILARLGPRVLRTETAAPAAVAVLQALLGDLA
jgi:16S rRNA (uracil1498-N3)-methyltransferase